MDTLAEPMTDAELMLRWVARGHLLHVPSPSGRATASSPRRWMFQYGALTRDIAQPSASCSIDTPPVLTEADRAFLLEHL